MMGRIPLIMISVLIVVIGGFVYSPVKAIDKEYKTLSIEKARETQLSLSGKPRTMSEIKTMMSPFFTDKFTGEFIQENVHTTNEGSLTYGSDAANLYVPDVNLSESETVRVDQHKWMVVHVAEHNEGPFSLPAHSIVLSIKQDKDGEKIDSIQYDIPEEVTDIMDER